MNTTTTTTTTDVNTRQNPSQEFMNKLETDGEKKSKELLQQVIQNQISLDDFGQKLQKVMTDGAKEFQQKNGRPMTYSEMRNLYG
jgi:hypothetical protein